jgi:hypothetical protein
MNSIGWRSIMMRLLAVAFSLGAWAGIVVGVHQLLGVKGPAPRRLGRHSDACVVLDLACAPGNATGP